MVIALAVHDEQQRFLGMATVTTDISALLHEFQDLHLGPDSVVTLRRIDDGSLVIRSLGTLVTDAFPERRMVIPQAIQQGTPQGHLEIVSPADGITRMYGYRVIDHSPLYVAVGLAEKGRLTARACIRGLGSNLPAHLGHGSASDESCRQRTPTLRRTTQGQRTSLSPLDR
ncbi:MAG: hypothetical protein AB3X41_08530 [Leptothrix ochracea]|uniref:hypothetical protein n=1 Tax=Leptothrix ochracea TaxID=735331 RepID=UPI0034E2DE32